MDRDALIEALAKSRLSRSTNIPWDDATEDTKEWMREVVGPDVDVVVEFMAEYLETIGSRHWIESPDDLVPIWREEMAGA